MNEECTVTFEGSNGGTYYVACSLVRYIDKETMVNNGNTSISLYPAHGQGQTQNTITIQALSYPRYQSGNQYVYITNARNIRFNALSHFYREYDYVQVMFLAVIAVASVLKVFTRKGR